MSEGRPSDDELEDFFLREINALDDDEDCDRIFINQLNQESATSNGTIEGMDDVESCSVTAEDTEWNEFLNSSNVISQKLNGFETDIALAVELQLFETAHSVDYMPPYDISIGGPEQECKSFVSVSVPDAVDESSRARVAVVIEDMILSLEQLWTTTINSCVHISPVQQSRDEGMIYENFVNLTIIDDFEDPPSNSATDNNEPTSNAAKAKDISSMKEKNRLALQSLLDAEHAGYLQHEIEAERLQDEELQRLKHRQYRRKEAARQQQRHRAAVRLQCTFRVFLAIKHCNRIRIKKRQEIEQRSEADELLAMQKEELQLVAMWTRISAAEAERQRLLDKKAELMRQVLNESDEKREMQMHDIERRRRTDMEKERVDQKQHDVFGSAKDCPKNAASRISKKVQSTDGSEDKISSWGGLLNISEDPSTPGHIIDGDLSSTQEVLSLLLEDCAIVPSNKTSQELIHFPEDPSTPGHIINRDVNFKKQDALSLLSEDCANVPSNMTSRSIYKDTIDLNATPTFDAICLSDIENFVQEADELFEGYYLNIKDTSSDFKDVKNVLKESNCTAITRLFLEAYESWRRWLSVQSTDATAVYTDESSQNRYIEEIDHFRYRCVPTSISNSCFVAEYTVENLDNLSFLAKRTDIRHLILNVNRLSSLTEISGLVELNSLSVRDNCIRTLKGLDKLTKLRSLVLDANQIYDMSDIANLTALVALSACTNELTEIPTLNSPHLQRLNLYHNRICSVQTLSSIRSRVLTHLDLGRNKLNAISGEAISQCQLLTQLILSQNCLESVPYPLRLPNLKILWISGNKLIGLKEWSPVLTAAGSEKTFPCFLPRLEKLYLQDNAIQELDEYCFSSMPLLTHIDLSFNNIGQAVGDHSVRSDLRALRRCTLLLSVQLQDNPVNTHRSAVMLSLLATNPSIADVSGFVPTNVLGSKDLLYQQDAESALCSHLKGLPAENENRTNICCDDYSATRLGNPVSGVNDCRKSRSNFCIGDDTAVRDAFADETFNRTCSPFHDLICCINCCVTSSKLISKYEAKDPDRTSGEAPSTSQPQCSKFDPLLINGIESADFLVLLLRSTRLLYTWPQIDSCLSNPNAIYRTMGCDGENGDVSYSFEKLPQPCSDTSSWYATIVQKCFRGYRTRKLITGILKKVYYDDEELDDIMLSDNLLEDFALPELDDDYWKVSTHKEQDLLNCGDNFNRASVVYGDHIKARLGAVRSSSLFASNDVTRDENTNNSHRTSSGSRSQLLSDSKPNWAEAVSVGVEYSKWREENHYARDRIPTQLSSRPTTDMSDLSVASSQAHSIDDFEYTEDASKDSTPRNYSRIAVTDEWGFTDPHVIEAMKKRSKRLKGFETAKEKREKIKHADERLRLFVRQASRHPNQASGAFGGKPKLFKGIRPRQRAVVHPAWLGVGSSEEHSSDK